jgi:hypothetical protein
MFRIDAMGSGYHTASQSLHGILGPLPPGTGKPAWTLRKARPMLALYLIAAKRLAGDGDVTRCVRLLGGNKRTSHT